MTPLRVCANPRCRQEFEPLTPRAIGRQKYCSYKCGKAYRYVPVENDGRRMPKSAEMRERISVSLRGRPIAPDSLAKRVAAQTGRTMKPDAVQRMRERMRGQPLPISAVEKSVAARKGKPLSASHRAKLSEIQKIVQNIYPPEIRSAIKILGKLKRAIREK